MNPASLVLDQKTTGRIIALGSEKPRAWAASTPKVISAAYRPACSAGSAGPDVGTRYTTMRRHAGHKCR